VLAEERLELFGSRRRRPEHRALTTLVHTSAFIGTAINAAFWLHAAHAVGSCGAPWRTRSRAHSEWRRSAALARGKCRRACAPARVRAAHAAHAAAAHAAATAAAPGAAAACARFERRVGRAAPPHLNVGQPGRRKDVVPAVWLVLEGLHVTRGDELPGRNRSACPSPISQVRQATPHDVTAGAAKHCKGKEDHDADCDRRSVDVVSDCTHYASFARICWLG